MKWMRETTVWEGDIQPNHLYLMEGDLAYAYIKSTTNEHRVFKKPLRMDLRGRTFKNEGEFKIKPRNPALRKITGSKGEVYEVNVEEGTCTCPGFRYRGACRHVADLQQPST